MPNVTPQVEMIREVVTMTGSKACGKWVNNRTRLDRARVIYRTALRSSSQLVASSLFLCLGLLPLSASADPPIWAELAPTGPILDGRPDASAVYDSATDKLIVFAGVPAGGSYNSPSSDTWILVNATGTGGTPTWTSLSPAGSAPPGRQGHTAVYDPATNRMIVFGGTNGVTNGLNDVWILANANDEGGAPAWIAATPLGTPPSPRYHHSAIYDATSNQMVVFGGLELSGPVNDLWVLSHANGVGGTPTWSQIVSTGGVPAGRYGHSAVYDPATSRMVIFGGGLLDGGAVNDLWILANATGSGGTPTWSAPSFAGTPPTPRWSHSAVYDATTKAMLLFGGITGAGASGEVWRLANAPGVGATPAWTLLSPLGAPGPEGLYAHKAVYSRAADRMVVFGGCCGPWFPHAWGLENSLPVSQSPRLGVSPVSLDFGSVTVGSSKQLSVTITNTGSRVLAGSATTIGPFSIITGGSFSLNAGTQQSIIVKFSPVVPGIFATSLVLTVEGTTTSVSLSGAATAHLPDLVVTL